MNKKPIIHTIATSHLDTSWLWKLEQSISDYLPETMISNFKLLEKYPEYKFNFEGSLRYEFIKEYYPEQYERVKKYISEKRWNPCGASFENGDVNIPSPEALIRNILYGNSFFRKEFNCESNDIFLPDCFGFGKALPTVASHCGLKGFSTGKLFWGSSVPIPFDIGKWHGIDGKYIWASLMPFSYTTAFGDMNKAKRIHEKLAETQKKNLPEITFAYHGNGDRGGAPHKNSVKNVAKAQRNNNTSDFEVYSSTTKEFFDILDSMPEDKKNIMPSFDGEFLLTEHGAGSYTSRTVTKRWNRRCELLADACERFASAAFALGLSDYPQYSLDSAWKKVLAHHFHDDITGTSFEECYIRSHNDYVQALKTFSSEYTAACKNISNMIDTSFCEGIPVIVSNPVQSAATRVTSANVCLDIVSENISVFDKDGNEIASQLKISDDNKTYISFAAEVPSCGFSVYDIRESLSKNRFNTGLNVETHLIENNYIKVLIDVNGDISSIFDKTLQKELLSAPIKLSVMNNTHSFDWPAWEIKYKDCCENPRFNLSEPEIRILDEGPVSCSIEIVRSAGKSKFHQIVSLDFNSRFISVYNETDWREEASLLKAEFKLASSNQHANYDIGLGYTKRSTNTEKLYEVPSQKWADISDDNKDFGVTVFSDSRCGWDKPDDSTLRLTLIHTPMANYRWECSQHIMDMGLNRYSYAVMGHEGSPDNITEYADYFCQPVHTFVTDKHSGIIESNFSFVSIDNDQVRISALKKAQDSEYIILRVAECSGNDIKNVTSTFNMPISEAYEVRGDEIFISEIPFNDNRISFDINKNSIKSFAIKFKSATKIIPQEQFIILNYNSTGITSDHDYPDSTLKNKISVPKELLPFNLLTGGINYIFTDKKLNCLTCDGSEINIDGDYDKLHLLITSTNGDKTVNFTCGDSIINIDVSDCFEPIGHWDLMQQRKTGYIKNTTPAITFSHSHNSDGNVVAKQFYVFHAEIPLEKNRKVVLPKDNDIVIFAATATNDPYLFNSTSEHFDKLSKRKFDYIFSEYAEKLMKPTKVEKLLDKMLDRTYTIHIKIDGFYNKYSLSELYHIFRFVSNKINHKKNCKKYFSDRNIKTD